MYLPRSLDNPSYNDNFCDDAGLIFFRILTTMMDRNIAN